jgi:nucleoside phosphorylase/tetratricopeptide (TPR) repeat protein
MDASKCEVVILTALPFEYQAVVAHLQDSQEVVHPTGTIYSLGQFQGERRRWRVAVAQVGTGGTQAAIEAEKAISFFPAQVALFVGIAGGRKDVQLGDIVVATKIYAYESGKDGAYFEPRPELWHPSHALEQRARHIGDEWVTRLSGAKPTTIPRVHLGPLAAGAKVLASTQSETAALLAATYGDALAVEMEGHGFLQAIQVNPAVHGLVVRGIANLIDGKTEADGAGYQEIAARHATAFAFQILAKFMLPSEYRLSLSNEAETGRGPTPPSVFDQKSTVFSISGQLDSSSSREERAQRLRFWLVDHSGFLQDRMESFVGRQRELEELRDLITKRQQTGGYVAITGQAGQGKSSLIAKLVYDANPEQAAFHFIPVNPGPDYQVGLLRNLMARLVLKYDLPEFYVTHDSRSVLRDIFPKVLTEIANKGGKEILFIDGLDQLEEESTGVRDLSFLPVNPPAGIVFVLGTRPDDTLKPLKLLKPFEEYPLPNLSRVDFDGILQHRGVRLEPGLADRLYLAMEKNALYLHLVARELRENVVDDPLALLAKVTDNPDHIFSVALERLKRSNKLWERILYPVLGVLLVAREPLALRLIRQIIGIKEVGLRDGLQRLGGLVIADWQQRYSLFHRKFYEYLRQDESHPGKDYLFATDEERNWHTRLARWCEKDDPTAIWQDNSFQSLEDQRLLYAREHYLTHLYLAQEWPRLFAVLDAGDYGRYKIQVCDPSTRSYALDLDLGRRAAGWAGWGLQEGIAYLPTLWRYTLLRCSLRSRADQYPLATFRLLLRLGKEREVIGLANLLTKPSLKVSVLLELVHTLLASPQGEAKGKQYFLLAWAVARSIGENFGRASALREIAEASVRCNEEESDMIWQEAQEATYSISGNSIFEIPLKATALRELAEVLSRAKREEQAEAIWRETEETSRSISRLWELEDILESAALRELTAALARARRWEHAYAVAHSIRSEYQQACALGMLAEALFEAQQHIQAETIWQEAEAGASTIGQSNQQAEALRVLAGGLTKAHRWDQAEAMALALEDGYQRAWALRELAGRLTEAQHEERAEAIWQAAEKAVRSLKQPAQQAEALRELTEALNKAGRWDQAEAMALALGDAYQQAWALSELACSLIMDNQSDRAQRLCHLAQGAINAIAWGQAEARALLELARGLTCAWYEDLAEAIWQEAEKVARSIKKNKQRFQLLQELAEALIQAGRWDQAETVARSLNQDDQQARALRMLTEALAQGQYWDRAEAVARSIGQGDYRAWALRVLAEALSQELKEEQAEGIWREAEEAARSLEQRSQQAWILRELAEALTRMHREEQAETIWREAEEAARSLEEDDQKAGNLRNLVAALVKAQRWDQAYLVARSIEQGNHQAAALSALAEAWDQAESREQAERIWQEATRVVRSLQESVQKADALRELAGALTRAQRREQAEVIWQEAEAAARSIELEFQKVGVLCELARELTEAGYKERAEVIWRDVLEGAHALGESSLEAMMLSKLVTAFIQVQYWEQAEAVARSIEDILVKTVIFSELAKALAQAQRWDQLRRIESAFWETSLFADLQIAHVSAVVQQQDYTGALHMVQDAWLQTQTKEAALNLLPLAFGLMTLRPEMWDAWDAAFKWVHAFLEDAS